MYKLFLLILLFLPLGIAQASDIKQVPDEETIINVLRAREDSLSSCRYEATIDFYITDVDKYIEEIEDFGIYDPTKDPKEYIKVGFDQKRFLAIQKTSDLEVRKAYNGEDFKIYVPENRGGKITSIYKEYHSMSPSVVQSESIPNVTVSRLLGLGNLREWLLLPSKYSCFIINSDNNDELAFRLLPTKENSSNFELQVILDKTKDYAIKEQTIYKKDGSKSDTYKVTKFEKVDDIWIPVEGVLNSYALKTAKSEEPLYYFVMKVTDLSVNEPIEDSFFEIEFPHGTYVEDELVGVSYTVGDPEIAMSTIKDITKALVEQDTPGIAVEQNDYITHNEANEIEDTIWDRTQVVDSSLLGTSFHRIRYLVGILIFIVVLFGTYITVKGLRKALYHD